MKNISWVFFDMGGTLIDESAQVLHIVSEIRYGFYEFGLYYSPEKIYRLLIKGSKNFISNSEKAAIRALSENEEQYESVLPAAHYHHELEYLFPEVESLLETLSKKYRLGIIGNQDLGGEERLKGHGIHHFFSVFALSAELGVKKPDPRIFELALQMADCKAENAAFVGDRLDNDIYPAKALGFTTVRVLQGYASHQRAPSKEYEPDFTVESISDISKLF